MTKLTYTKWKLYKISTPVEGVLHIQFDRPKVHNAVNSESWRQFKQIFDQAEFDPDVRAIVLSGEGKSFCAGLDVKAAAGELGEAGDDDDFSRQSIKRYNFIKEFQAAIARPHTINKPVIAAIYGNCLGLGIDIISACDIRFASKDSIFSIREAQIGMAADIGTLQRLPRVVNNLGWLKEVAYTGRDFDVQEAYRQGLADRIYNDKQQTIHYAIQVAADIASKSPVAIHGTKKAINYALDHTLADGLEQIAEFNAHGLGADFMEGTLAAMSKKKPVYAKL